MSVIEFLFLIAWIYSIITYKSSYQAIKGKPLAHNYTLYSYFISLNGVVVAGILWFLIKSIIWLTS